MYSFDLFGCSTRIFGIVQDLKSFFFFFNFLEWCDYTLKRLKQLVIVIKTMFINSCSVDLIMCCKKQSSLLWVIVGRR